MRQFEAEILENVPVGPGCMRIVFAWPENLESPQPGQFFTLRTGSLKAGASPLLRRPLAFAGFTAIPDERIAPANAGKAAHAVYLIRGHATEWLAAVRPGVRLDIIAPLGNPFPEPEEPERPLLAAGGIGIGPVLYLAASLIARGKRAGRDFDLVLGYRDSRSVPSLGNALSVAASGAVICTDNGSAGVKGTVMDGIESLYPEGSPPPVGLHLYGCGPGRMLAALAARSARWGVPAHLSAEQWMACGVGACQGCVLPASAGGYLRACTEGPVFKALDILWEACP